MKKLGLFIIVGLLSMTIPQMNANTFTVQAATIKKVTGIKKNRVKDGSYFYSKKKYYDGCYRKISWKKIKKVSGYQVYRYDYYLKKWNRVLTTKNNYFKITDTCEGEKLKLKVRAYKKKKGKTIYGRFSKALIYTENTLLYYTKNDKLVKKGCYVSGLNGYHKNCEQQAFTLQNEYRKKVGVKQLEWSEVLYEICKSRAKEIVNDFSHNKLDSTAQKVLKDKYNYDKWMLRGKVGTKEYGLTIVSGENIFGGSTSPKQAMTSWKNSPGHYHNMIHSDYRYGAMASYEGRWVAIFSMVDVDEIVLNNNMESLESALQILDR
ncbi:MAG: CAP domain-containing protein [Eubacterium ventriosum]|jgi:uncharacterized protein YkwD|uniref:CAP domain-containing protein n=1 Tax=Eubacterium sp. AF17-7 TaxID=2293105 RepID=UPI000E4B7013|nr:CAP domain-containing protein [Eubacterium sp. AF17-7]RGG65667.1 CAP domain-containing protein [Eubacterium sp. AF17-7]